VSDHGFAAVTRDVNLLGAFVDAGLVTRDAKGAISAWNAMPWFAGGSAAVVLARPDDAALRARVEALLAKLAANPELHIERWITRSDIAAAGGADADYFVNFKAGTEMGRNPQAPLVGPSAGKGMHGYFPATPEMRAMVIANGPDVHGTGDRGTIDMRSIAPSVARLLGVDLVDATLEPQF
jgi:hypothetical protein